MYDSLGEPYPTERHCFPGVGPQTPTGNSGLGECNGSSPGVVFSWGRFFSACSACDAGFTPTDCRPFVCETDADCPLFKLPSDDGVVTREYECRNELCQSTDLDKYPEDIVDVWSAMELCLADVPRDEHYDGEPYCPGVELSSPEACPLPLPETCMQP